MRAHARELERRGHEVQIVAPRPGGAFGWPGVAARIEERPARIVEAGRWVLAARARVARMAIDKVVAHWAIPAALPIAVAARAPLHVVSHGGDVRLLLALPAPVRRVLSRRLVARACEWSFVSPDLLAELLAALDPETRARLRRVANVRAPPLELPDVAAATAHLRRELAGRPVAVSVGRLVESKRVDRAIDYVARSMTPYVLVIVGDGPARRSLERHARARGVAARFVGNLERDRALVWIGAADVLLHASDAEGLSTVVREAEALGTKVVRLSS